MCRMEELMPSVGTPVPSPSILAVVISQTDSILQNIGKLCSDVYSTSSLIEDFNNPFDFCDETLIVSKTHLISISDDGKIWKWLLTAEGSGDDAQKGISSSGTTTHIDKVADTDARSGKETLDADDPPQNLVVPSNNVNDNRIGSSNRPVRWEEVSFKVCLLFSSFHIFTLLMIEIIVDCLVCPHRIVKTESMKEIKRKTDLIRT